MSQISRTFDGNFPPGTVVETLTGNDSIAVGPNGANNIFLLGTGALTVTNTAANTLSISNSEDVVVVTTNDATPTTLWSYTLPPSTAISFNALLVAAQSDWSTSVSGYQIGGARRGAAGGAQVVQDWPTFNFDTTAFVPRFEVVTSGNDVILQVTGGAGVTYNWRARVMFTTL